MSTGDGCLETEKSDQATESTDQQNPDGSELNESDRPNSDEEGAKQTEDADDNEENITQRLVARSPVSSFISRSVEESSEEDGGLTQDDFQIGMRVLDSEDPDPDPAVVINLPPATIRTWGAYYDDGNEVTVAEDNPDYDPYSRVVVTAFERSITGYEPGWDPEDDEPIKLDDTALPSYSFPPDRLEIIDDSDDDEDESEAESADEPEPDADPEEQISEDFAALRDRLADSASVELDQDGDGVLLIVEKLGTSYEVRPSGEINGDGPLRDRVEGVVDEFL